MGNIVTAYLNKGEGLGNGYINYDRDFTPTEEDMEQLVVMVSHGLDNTYNVFIACPVPSRWNSVLFSGTALNGSSRETELITKTILEDSPYITYYNEGRNVRGRNVTIASQTWKYVEWTSLLSGAFVPFDGNDPLNDFAFKLPVWDGADVAGNSNTDKLVNIVTNNLPPSNEDVINGDVGITTWDVYIYNLESTYPSYRIVWKNDYIESHKMAGEYSIIMHSEGVPQLNVPAIEWKYDYTQGYFTTSILEISPSLKVDTLKLLAYPVTLEVVRTSDSANPKNRSAGFTMVTGDRNENGYVLPVTTGGDVIKFHVNETGEDDYGYLQRVDDLDEINSEYVYGTNYSNLVNSYSTSDGQLTALGNAIWTKDFEGLFKINTDPVANILSIFRTPFSVPAGEETTIKIGNFDSEIQARKLAENIVAYNVGRITFKSFYNNFLDLDPFTKCYIYLPLVGIVNVSANLLQSGVDIYYTVLFKEGKCSVTLRKNGNVLNEYECMAGDSIQLSSSDYLRQQQTMAGYGLIDVLTGSIGFSPVSGAGFTPSGSAKGLYDLSKQFASASETVKRGGNFASNISASNGYTIYMIYARPKYQEPLNYAHTHGKPCNLTKTISTLRGYTKVAGNVDLSGIPCTESQRQMIFERLTTGFYV